MAGGGNDGAGSGQAGLPGELRPELAGDGSRLHQLTEDPGRQAGLFGQVEIPGSLAVLKELGGARDGQLRGRASSKEAGDEVSDMEQVMRPAECFGSQPVLCRQLKESVEVDQLHPGPAEELLPAHDAGGEAPGLAGMTLVAVVDRVLKQLPIFIEEPVVDPPAVDRDPVELPAVSRGGLADSLVDIVHEGREVPAQASS